MKVIKIGASERASEIKRKTKKKEGGKRRKERLIKFSEIIHTEIDRKFRIILHCTLQDEISHK